MRDAIAARESAALKIIEKQVEQRRSELTGKSSQRWQALMDRLTASDAAADLA